MLSDGHNVQKETDEQYMTKAHSSNRLYKVRRGLEERRELCPDASLPYQLLVLFHSATGDRDKNG